MSFKRPPKMVTKVEALMESGTEKKKLSPYRVRGKENALGRAEHLVSEILRILPIIVLGFTAALAQTAGEIGGREGAVEIKVDGRLCHVRGDVEIRRVVRRERSVLHRRRLDREHFR